MGQHKTNPTALAAKRGELPPKQKPTMSKRERERRLYAECEKFIHARFIKVILHRSEIRR